MEVLSPERPNDQPAAGVECTICLSNIGSDVGVLRCNHSFCFECVENWSNHENSCPLCKTRFTFIDKVSKNDSQTEQTTGGKKPKKTRVKIKRKNQTDYEPSSGGGVDVWANFIASLIGAGNQHLRRFHGLASDMPFGFGLGSGRPRVIRGPRVMRPARRTAMVPRRSMGNTEGSSANNPILLSDDEDESNGNGAQRSTARLGASGSAGDLVDLTDDQNQEAMQPAPTARSSSAYPGIPAPAAAGDGYYDSEEEDDDYEPSLLFDAMSSDGASEDSNDIDHGELPSDVESSYHGGRGGSAEVVELSDSDADSSDRDDAVIPLVGMPHHRLSGVMLWCGECDTFHDKQRVLDDRAYCPGTFDALVESAAASPALPTQDEESAPAASRSAAAVAAPAGASSSVRREQEVYASSSSSSSSSRTDRVSSWIEIHHPRHRSPSNDGTEDMEQKTVTEKDSGHKSGVGGCAIVRTQSDATTSSSRSSSSSSAGSSSSAADEMAAVGSASVGQKRMAMDGEIVDESFSPSKRTRSSTR